MPSGGARSERSCQFLEILHSLEQRIASHRSLICNILRHTDLIMMIVQCLCLDFSE